ncbi:MAG: hypothetical protein KDH91_17970 [Rhodoferax sp.]|nr:hypothetical protein [Rhodoferax sp.]MCB2040889.1 hypothetical protein [Rhodoferax sp.]
MDNPAASCAGQHKGDSMQSGAVLSIIGSLFLSACAKASTDVAAADGSPLRYQAYECDQIEAEARRLNTRLLQVGGRREEATSNDRGITAVDAVLFWPALFAPGGTADQQVEFARLMGARDALHQVSIQKRCGMGPSRDTALPSTTAALRAPAAAVTKGHAARFPGPFGTLVLTDSLTKVKRSIVVKVEEDGPARTVYSTGDVIASDGTLLETRVGELVIRTESGALWAVPVRPGISGQAAFVTTLGGFKGVIRWQAVAEDATRVRIDATTYWAGGGGSGRFVASYAPDSPVALSFKTEISSPAAASYAQGYAPPDRTTAVLTRR